MSNLANELKQMIIDVLALEDIQAADIDDTAPLLVKAWGSILLMPWSWVWPLKTLQHSFEC